jgi:hypothetical protein
MIDIFEIQNNRRELTDLNSSFDYRSDGSAVLKNPFLGTPQNGNWPQTGNSSVGTSVKDFHSTSTYPHYFHFLIFAISPNLMMSHLRLELRRRMSVDDDLMEI